MLVPWAGTLYTLQNKSYWQVQMSALLDAEQSSKDFASMCYLQICAEQCIQELSGAGSQDQVQRVWNSQARFTESAHHCLGHPRHWPRYGLATMPFATQPYVTQADFLGGDRCII